MRHVSCFFFFQAEDGIRDGRVTGVQTCALPICAAVNGSAISEKRKLAGAMSDRVKSGQVALRPARGPDGKTIVAGAARRSEERRVGKECRARGAPED